MNTPAHAIINLLVLTRNTDHRRTAAIMVGAIIPDLVIIIFYSWHLILGTAENQIWSIEYYHPLWQGLIDSFNSVPIILLAMLLCWHWRQYLLLALCASMLLHTFGDLPLHHDDAHRHFFPLLEWRFSSPVSYWDPAHYGLWVSLVEISCVIGASFYLWSRWPGLKPWVAGSLAVYLGYWTYVYRVWM